MNRCLRTSVAALTVLALAAAPALAAPPDQTSPLPNPTGCDSIDTSACLLPFPDDLYTKADPSTRTGRRVDLNLLAMPRNIAGKPIDPTDQNRADGFSPGSMIVTKIAGLDTDAQLDALGAPHICNPDASLLAGSPVVVIDAEHRAAADGLGRARPLARRARRHAGRPDADHPPVEELPRGPPLHRRAAAAAPSPRAPRSRPTATRRRSPAPTRCRRGSTSSAAPTSRTCSPRSPTPASLARTSPRPGTSPSRRATTSPAGCCTSATTRSPSSATRTSATSRCRAGPRASRSPAWST